MSSNDVYRTLRLIDFDKLFRETPDPVILNRFNFKSHDHADRLSEAIFSRVGDVDFVARCECDHLVGNYYIDTVCPKCNKVVRHDMEAADGFLQHKAWLACPSAISGGWLNPSAYSVLSRFLSYGKKIPQHYAKKTDGDIAMRGKEKKGNYLDDILDTEIKTIPEDLQMIITGKGFTYLHDNFDRIMEYFLYHHKKTSIKSSRDVMVRYIATYRDRIFCHYIPVLSKTLQTILSGDTSGPQAKGYVDKNSRYIHAAANGLSFLEFSRHRASKPALIEKTTYEAFQEIIAYLSDISVEQLSHKKSIPRAHIFGSRMHNTFRGVIVPITGVIERDALHMPWGMLVNLLRDHIIGQLAQQGWTMGAATKYQQSVLTKYDKFIHDMLLRFIAESKFKGLPVLFNRNPSIRAGSIYLMYITKVKTDVHDRSIGISSIITGLPNADFDGDEMNGLLLVENDAVEIYKQIHPDQLYMSRNSMEVNSMTNLPKEVLAVINTFLGRV